MFTSCLSFSKLTISFCILDLPSEIIFLSALPSLEISLEFLLALNTQFFFFFKHSFLLLIILYFFLLAFWNAKAFPLASIATVKVLFHSFVISIYAIGLFFFLPVFKIVSLSLVFCGYHITCIYFHLFLLKICCFWIWGQV